MESKVLISRAIQYQKAASDNLFSIFATLQNGGEKMVEETLDQCTWFPESGKKGIVFWYDTCTKTTDSFKQMIDQSYEEAQKYIDSSEVKSQSKEKVVQPAKKTVKKTQVAPVRRRQQAKPKPDAAKTKAAITKETKISKSVPVRTETKSKKAVAKSATAKKAVTKASPSTNSKPAGTIGNTKSAVQAKPATATSTKVSDLKK